ncbi:MAG: large subunit ribosomal protein [Candidatus Binatota bacterium]|nr:large subunit ribosomal protein [Candidatus Binatota bacterium]
MAEAEQVRVSLRRSEIGGTQRQRQTLRGLGLRRIGDSRVLPKTPAVLGMIDKVRHLLDVDEST